MFSLLVWLVSVGARVIASGDLALWQSNYGAGG